MVLGTSTRSQSGGSPGPTSRVGASVEPEVDRSSCSSISSARLGDMATATTSLRHSEAPPGVGSASCGRKTACTRNAPSKVDGSAGYQRTPIASAGCSLAPAIASAIASAACAREASGLGGVVVGSLPRNSIAAPARGRIVTAPNGCGRDHQGPSAGCVPSRRDAGTKRSSSSPWTADSVAIASGIRTTNRSIGVGGSSARLANARGTAGPHAIAPAIAIADALTAWSHRAAWIREVWIESKGIVSPGVDRNGETGPIWSPSRAIATTPRRDRLGMPQSSKRSRRVPIFGSRRASASPPTYRRHARPTMLRSLPRTAVQTSLLVSLAATLSACARGSPTTW